MHSFSSDRFPVNNIYKIDILFCYVLYVITRTAVFFTRRYRASLLYSMQRKGTGVIHAAEWMSFSSTILSVILNACFKKCSTVKAVITSLRFFFRCSGLHRLKYTADPYQYPILSLAVSKHPAIYYFPVHFCCIADGFWRVPATSL